MARHKAWSVCPFPMSGKDAPPLYSNKGFFGTESNYPGQGEVMQHCRLVAFAVALIAIMTAVAAAATEVRMEGDARVYGLFWSGHNFTGWKDATWTSNRPTWSRAGTKTEDSFEIWQRLRLRTDLAANKDVKFRLGLKVDSTWGYGTYTAANPEAAVQVYIGYLQCKWPETDIEITAGLQPFALPQSSIFTGSLLFDEYAAVFNVMLSLIPETMVGQFGFGRMVDSNQSYDSSTTQVADELDLYYFALPITLSGFKVTPWGVVGVVGSDANLYTTSASTIGRTTLADELLSAGSVLSSVTAGKCRNSQDAYFWAGGAFEITALDPIRFYFDMLYGGNLNDYGLSKRSGWFIDFGAQYTGFDILIPQVFAWWSTGEDNSFCNGSERMPHLKSAWSVGPEGSILFDGGQVLARNSMIGIEPTGSTGFAVGLRDISFIKHLSSSVMFVYVTGTNSSRSMRYLNTALGSNPYYMMGRDLAINEHAYSIDFNSKYKIYENLTARIEAGWGNGHFLQSVWGRRLVKQAEATAGSWKIACGLTYKF